LQINQPIADSHKLQPQSTADQDIINNSRTVDPVCSLKSQQLDG